jgi:two-component system, LytTR family, response regulator AlgR
MNVLVVDDEELARLRLVRLLEELAPRIPGLRVAGQAADARQALQWLQRERCDLVLLDVQMPGLSGTELAARLRNPAATDAALAALPPALVFVTAHAEHAVHAFELDATDYLTKPVRLERLHQALLRVQQRLAATAAAPNAEPDATEAQPGVLVVHDRGRVHRVPVADVLYLKAELKYVTLRTAEHSYVLDDSLSDLELRLGERFLRVHRNALVAKRAIRALERHALEGEDAEGWAVRVAPLDEWLAVSRRQMAAVREALSGEGV